MATAVFEELGKTVGSDPSLVKGIGGIYQFNVNSSGKTTSWTVDLKNGNGAVKNGPAEKADCTLTLKEEDFVDMANGKLNGQQAFMQGKLKISGNMALAMKLNQLFKKKAPEAAKPATPATAAPAAKKEEGPLAAVFEQLSKTVASNPDLVKKVNGVYQFNVNNGKGETKQWTVDLKNGAGSVKAGPAEKADCTLTMKESDFIDMMSGKIDGQAAFMQGKLKISGNMSFAMKLGQLTKAQPKATSKL